MTADAVGGVWTYAMELCAALAPEGIHVTLAVLGPPPNDVQRAEAHACGNVELEEIGFALEWMDEPWADVDRAGERLLALETVVHPDVVHLGGYAHGALPFEAPVVVVAHSCVLSWWSAVHGEHAPPRYDEYHERLARGVHAADAVVAPTRAMLDAVGTHYGLPARALVIHNGRDTSRFAPTVKLPVVLAAGRLWDEAKNVAALDHVAPFLPWEVRLAGDTRAPDGTVRPIRHARALGPLTQSELAAEMGHASIFALPARYEPFGLSVLEAALSGCALVLGDIPSLRELWDGVALFVPPNDDAALTDALGQLVSDPDRRARLATAARTRAQFFTPRRTAQSYSTLYQALRDTHSAEVYACAS